MSESGNPKPNDQLPRLNADWHRAHRMPKSPSLAQRIAWHEEHSRVCGCRPMPDRIAAVLRARADAGK